MKNRLETGTVRCEYVSDHLSEYLEGGLPPPDVERLEDHLVECDGCAEEARQMATLLKVLHQRVPRREPTLDIWAELGPKVAAIQEEERLSVPVRFRRRMGRFLGNLAAGAILFTQALAINTEERLKPYLMTDPYRLAEEER
ncbi:MAG: hypothetical protein OHK0029_21300 [Armatimonadaceae bacterium]